MSTPSDKLKENEMPPLVLPPTSEQPKRRFNIPFNYDRSDGVANKDLVQRMKEKVVLNSVLWKFNETLPKRQIKIVVINDKGGNNIVTPAPTPRNSICQSTPPLKSIVGFKEEVATIEPEIKSIKDRNGALLALQKIKGLSISLTPGLKKQTRGRSRTSEDIDASKASVRRPTPYPKAPAEI